jgi:hypothetical protein
MREREVFGGRQHLDGAGLVAAVPAIAAFVRDRGVFPWQGVDRREQAGLVLFHGEQAVRVLVLDDEPGGLALGVQRMRYTLLPDWYSPTPAGFRRRLPYLASHASRCVTTLNVPLQ